MTIKIDKETIGSKFYDEILYLSENYRIIKKKPDKRIGLMTNQITKMLLFMIAVGAINLWSYFKTGDVFDCIIIGISFAFLFFLLIWLVLVNKRIKELLKLTPSEKIEINDNRVRLIQEDGEKIVELSWDAIEYVLVSKYTISFIPKNVNSILIVIPIDKKNELLEVIKKYNKEHLLIDNEKLYQ